MRFGADYPDGNARRLHIFADTEIAKMLEESEEADITLFANSFQHKIVS